jgi:hypothetical protein
MIKILIIGYKLNETKINKKRGGSPENGNRNYE